MSLRGFMSAFITELKDFWRDEFGILYLSFFISTIWGLYHFLLNFQIWHWRIIGCFGASFFILITILEAEARDEGQRSIFDGPV